MHAGSCMNVPAMQSVMVSAHRVWFGLLQRTLLEQPSHLVQTKVSAAEVMAEVRALPPVAPPDLEALRLAYPPPGCFHLGCEVCSITPNAYC